MLGTKATWILTAAIVLGIWAGPAQSQALSKRPITLIVVQPAGSAVDVITRLYADAVSKSLGQAIVVDNRPGGGGVIGLQNLKQSAPDGTTLVVTANGPLTIAPWMRKLPYDVNDDFEIVATLFGFLQFLTVSAESPATSIASLISYAKEKPGGLTYSSLGVGSITHLLCAWVGKDSGTVMQHAPYNSTAQYLLDIATNRIDFTFASYQSTNSLWHDKKIKYLATTSAARSPLTPDVPTTAEAGFPKLRYGVWFALLAPKGTPAAIVDKLNEQFQQVSLDQQILQRLTREGIEAMITTPTEAKAMVTSESTVMKKLADEFGLAGK